MLASNILLKLSCQIKISKELPIKCSSLGGWIFIVCYEIKREVPGMTRIKSLDWQRGLLALSIMVYHFTAWKIYHPDAEDILGRLGIYGVSMFFVLSGLSMAIVYNRYAMNSETAVSFYITRIFRIWPLLWLAIGIILLERVATNQNINWHTVLLNLTTTFGFFSPHSYINTGAWSIGNEIVYYAVTPFILALYNKKLLYGNLLLIASIIIAAVFAFGLMSPDVPLAKQWHTYIHPANNLFLYCAGIAVFYNFKSIGSKSALALFAVALAVFIAYPADGDQIAIVTGYNRFIFSIASVLMVMAFYKANFNLPSFADKPLTQLGIATYGVYLLHPIVFHYSELAYFSNPYTHLAVVGTLTISISVMLFKYLGSPFIAFAKSITRHSYARNRLD